MKYNKEFYVNNPVFIEMHISEVKKTFSSNGWEIMLDEIDSYIEALRTNLEEVTQEKLKEIQYSIKNLRNLKDLPNDLITKITSFSSPPETIREKGMEFNYQ